MYVFGYFVPRRCIAGMLRKTWKKLEGINGLILVVYLVVVLLSQAFITESSELLYLCRSFFTLIAFFLLVCPVVLRRIRKLSISPADTEPTRKETRRWAICIFLVSFVCFFGAYLMCYPGGSSPDTISQLEQAMTNQYNDWHPVMHTLFAYKLPLVITGGWVGSIALCQMLLFSIVIAYAVITILVYTNRKFAVASFVFYMMNPCTITLSVIPWKDVSFAIGALLLLTYTVRIYFTKGMWLKKAINTILYVVVFALTTLFRHNAILFTIPIGIAALFYMPKKRGLVLLMSVAVLIVGVKYPLYSALEVASPGSRQIETLGLPMNVIGSVVTYNPDALDDETREFAYKIATPEKWEQMYTYGNYNTLKWDEQTNNDVIEEYGTARVLKMTLSCMLRSPQEAIKGLVRLTDPVYTLTDDFNDYRIKYSNSGLALFGSFVGRLISKIYIASGILANLVFPYLFHYIGVMMLVLLVSALSKCRLSKWSDIKRIMLIAPVFAYNFGTMLLLTGRNDATRFFYYTFLMVPVYLVFFFRQNNERKMDSGIHVNGQ